MNLSWSMVRRFLSLHLLMQRPSNHSVLLPSVMANLFWIWAVARSDSALELDMRRRSSTLVAEMEMPVADCLVYMLQSDLHLENLRDRYVSWRWMYHCLPACHSP